MSAVIWHFSCEWVRDPSGRGGHVFLAQLGKHLAVPSALAGATSILC